ncbi:MAG: YegS/Rv2252/BmrU family lipid kinase [Armatimonadetes bacterium]|nr:YegS/Rv2252/BmrU family lipid kinase [Armatimonadota bacterium]
MRTRLFLNSGSRQAEMRQEEVNTLFAKHKVEVESTELFDSIQELQIQVLAAINDGVEMIIAGGGDGTITASIEPMLGSDATLAILPLGTGNQFAKEIGIDSLESAVLAIKALRRARIDVATVNDRPFLNVATFGLTTEIAKNLHGKKLLGKAAYVPALFKAIKNTKSFEFRAKTETITHEFEAIQVVIANGRLHGGPFAASPDASLTDGNMDVYGVEPTSPLKLALAATLSLDGRHVVLEEVPNFKSSDFHVETKPSLPMVIDGETVWLDNPHFKVHPAALKVVVPENFRVPDNRLVV